MFRFYEILSVASQELHQILKEYNLIALLKEVKQIMYYKYLVKHQVFSQRNAWQRHYDLEQGRIVTPNE